MPEDLSDASHRTVQMRDRFAFLLIICATFGLQFLTLATGVIMARLLGVEGRGFIALVIAVSLFASQLTIGGSLPAALTKLIAERQIAARDGLRAITRRRAWMLLIPCVAAGVSMPLIQPSDTGGDRLATAVIVFVATFQTLTFQVVAGCLQGEGRLVRMAWVALAPQSLFTIVLGVVGAAGWSWSAYEVLAAYLATGLASVWFAYHSLMPSSDRADELPEQALWSEARNNYVSSVRPLDGLGLDRIIVGGLLGTASLGLFATALAVSNLCRLVSNAVRIVVLPRVAMYHADPAAQRAVIRRWVGISLGLVVVIVAVLEAIVSPIITLAFGENFLGAVAPARWLIVADGLLAVRMVLIAVLQGQGRGGAASWVEFLVLPLLLVGIVVAAQHDSLVGVGISLSVMATISCIALGCLVMKPPTGPRHFTRDRGQKLRGCRTRRRRFRHRSTPTHR